MQKPPVRLKRNLLTDSDFRDENGDTALMLASHHGHAEVVSKLVGEGAAVDLQSKSGATALIAASANNHSDVVRLLLQAGCAPNHMSEFIRTQVSLSRALSLTHSHSLSLTLSVCLSVGLSVCLSVCLSVSYSIYREALTY